MIDVCEMSANVCKLFGTFNDIRGMIHTQNCTCWVCIAVKAGQSYRSRKMLHKNALIAKFGVDRDENGPTKLWVCESTSDFPLDQINNYGPPPRKCRAARTRTSLVRPPLWRSASAPLRAASPSPARRSRARRREGTARNPYRRDGPSSTPR